MPSVLILPLLLFLLPCGLSHTSNDEGKLQSVQSVKIEKKTPNAVFNDASNVGQKSKKRLKILVNNPAMAWSHLQYQGRLADVLAEAGHEVHILVQAVNPQVANYTGTHRDQRIWPISRTPGKENDFLHIKFFSSFFGGPSSMLQQHEGMKDFQRISVELCEEMLADERLLAELESEHYDVGISECYFICAFGLFKRIGVRTSLATLAIGLNPLINHYFGIPTFASWDTDYHLPSLDGPAMGYWDRARNFYALSLEKLAGKESLALHQRTFEQYFGSNFPSPVDLMLNVSMLFVNRNEFFDLPHVLSSKVVNIGGIVDKHTNASLPAQIEKILANSKSGVVLFSFGTLVDANQMPHSLRLAFLSAFARFPNYEFIWKYKIPEGEIDLIGNIPPNVHLFEWVEQKALLQHPRLRTFITHCGLNSLNEAAREGVPVLGLPLFGDQHYNAALVKWKRNGVVIWDVRACEDERTLIDALTAVLEDPIYTNNAKLVSRKLRLSPFSPAERFVRWVEFAADYPELNELNLPYHEFSFLTYYCLDVIAFTLMGVVVALLAAFWAIRCLVHGFLITMCWMGLTKRTSVKKKGD